MKRRLLITIAVFLVAGAVLNAAVAWGCWFGSDAGLPSKRPVFKRLSAAEALKIAGDLGFVPQINPDGIPIVYANGVTLHCGYGTTLDVLDVQQIAIVERPYAEAVADLASMNYTYTLVERFQAGWPTHTMRGYEITVQDTETGRASAPNRWSLSSGERMPPFPLQPIWPSFSGYTLLYGVVLWLLICGPFLPRRLTRAIRAKRGCCQACGYPLGQSDVCSECGKPC